MKTWALLCLYLSDLMGMRGVSNKVAEMIRPTFLSDNFVLKNRAIHDIVTNNTPERQKLTFGRNMVERNFS